MFRPSSRNPRSSDKQPIRNLCQRLGHTARVKTIKHRCKAITATKTGEAQTDRRIHPNMDTSSILICKATRLKISTNDVEKVNKITLIHKITIIAHKMESVEEVNSIVNKKTWFESSAQFT